MGNIDIVNEIWKDNKINKYTKMVEMVKRYFTYSIILLKVKFDRMYFWTWKWNQNYYVFT